MKLFLVIFSLLFSFQISAQDNRIAKKAALDRALVEAAEIDQLKVYVALDAFAEGIEVGRTAILGEAIFYKNWRNRFFDTGVYSVYAVAGTATVSYLLQKKINFGFMQRLGARISLLTRPAVILSLASFASSGAVDLFADPAPRKAWIRLDFEHRIGIQSLVGLVTSVLNFSAEQSAQFESEILASLKSFLLRRSLAKSQDPETIGDEIFNVLEGAFDQMTLSEGQQKELTSLLKILEMVQTMPGQVSEKELPQQLDLKTTLEELQSLSTSIDDEILNVLGRNHEVSGDSQRIDALRAAQDRLKLRITQLRQRL